MNKNDKKWELYIMDHMKTSVHYVRSMIAIHSVCFTLSEEGNTCVYVMGVNKCLTFAGSPQSPICLDAGWSCCQCFCQSHCEKENKLYALNTT